MTLERRINVSTPGSIYIGGTSSLISSNTNNKFPPYDLFITDDEYRLTLAVAGYKKENIKISVDKAVLSIKGVWPDETKNTKGTYVVGGIAKRNFDLQFKLGEYVEVSSAKTEDGLLTILLFKNTPDDKKPKVIDID